MEKALRSSLTEIASEITNIVKSQEIRVRATKSVKNSDMIHTAVYLWVHLIGDTRDQTNLISLRARLYNFVKFTAEHDFNDVIETFAHASDLLIRNDCADYADFKHQLVSRCGFLPDLVISPVNDHIVDWFRDGEVTSLKSALTLLRFMRKIQFEVPSLKADALKKYLENEQLLAELTLPRDDVLALQRIIRKWMKEITFTDMIPHNGPGTVAENTKSKLIKYAEIVLDRKLLCSLGSLCHFDLSEKRKYVYTQKIGVIDRCSRMIFVPKTSKSLRPISAEPASLQYFQQGVKDKLYDYIVNHPYLRKRIHIKDQTFNQDWARIGSFTGELATIDLSSASDLVSYDLVKTLFIGTPLYKWILATRSSQTELPNGDRITLKKFAPMGSALCFPVESLIFAACCELVKERNLKQMSSHEGYLVFGDDMVVPTIFVKPLIDLLTSLGFSVNTEKSYWAGDYRESCGKEYFAGYDVSPIYCRVNSFTQVGDRAKAYSQLCDLANYAQEKGYAELRRAVILLIHNSFTQKVYPMFTHRTGISPNIYSATATNWRLKCKWSKDYQCYIYQCGTVVARPDDETSNQDIEYFDALISLAGRKACETSYDNFVRPVDTLSTQTTILRSVWKTLC